MPTTLEIMDVTIRDGSYLINFAYSPQQIEAIVRQLDEAGVSYIEAGHGVGLGAERLGYAHGATDLAYAQAAARGKRDSKIGAIGSPTLTTLDEISAVAEYYDFFRIMVNPDTPELAKDYIKHCQQEGLEVSVQLRRSYVLSPEKITDAVCRLSDWGADVVYLVDTTGCMVPGEVTRYVEAIRKRTDQKLGFHGHNTLQLALANSLEAIEAGCERVDASLLGMGKDAGNVFLEALVIVLQELKKPCKISLQKIIEAGEFIRPIFSSETRPRWYTYYLAAQRRDLYPIELVDILAHECNKTAFEVIDAYAAMPDIIEYTLDDIADLIRNLGGDAEAIFAKYKFKQAD